jgi:hypothetical protein
VYRCWVSEFQALSDMDANGTPTTLIQHLKLENEGWEREAELQEPTEGSFVEPPG